MRGIFEEITKCLHPDDGYKKLIEIIKKSKKMYHIIQGNGLRFKITIAGINVVEKVVHVIFAILVFKKDFAAVKMEKVVMVTALFLRSRPCLVHTIFV